MSKIYTQATAEGLRRIARQLEEELKKRQEKEKGISKLKFWLVERGQWNKAQDSTNTDWRVVIGAKGECYSGYHKTSVNVALNEAIQKYREEKTGRIE